MKKTFLFVLVLYASTALIAGDSLNVKTIGSYESSTLAKYITISGDYAYLSCFDMALKIIDVSDRTNPIEVSHYQTTDFYNPNGIHVSGTNAFLAYGFDNDSTGMAVVDISNESGPFEISYTPTELRAHDVYVSGSYAYVPECLGLCIYDISSPSTPDSIGYCEISLLSHPQCVFVSGNYAYVGGTKTLKIINITDPHKPFESGSCTVEPYVWGVFVSGNYACLAADISGLKILDVSDPSNPAVIGSYDTPGSANAVYVSGSYAYVADDFAGLRVIDISTPTTPQEVGYYETPNIALDVYASHPYAYVTCQSKGLQIYEYGELPVSVKETQAQQPCISCSLNKLIYDVAEKTDLRIYAPNGRLLLVTQISGKGAVDFSNKLVSGVYFAQLSDAPGNRVKLVIMN